MRNESQMMRIVKTKWMTRRRKYYEAQELRHYS